MNRLYNKVEVDTILSDQIASFQLLPWTAARTSTSTFAYYLYLAWEH